MPQPKTLGIREMTSEQRKLHYRSVSAKYDELATTGYYTDEEVIRLRAEIWSEVFQSMSVTLGINKFNPDEMSSADILRMLAEHMEQNGVK